MATPKLEGNGTSVTSQSKSAIAGGLGVGFGLAKILDLETGIYYIQSKFSYDSSVGELIEQLDALSLPLLFRFRFSRYFSLGLGGFVSMASGKVKTTFGGATYETAYDLAGLEDINYGALGSVTLELPLSHSVSFLVDGRYLLGLRNLMKDTSTKLETKNLLLMGGFRWIIGGSKN